MVLNKPFLHQPDAIASFDFIEIASGTGIITFSGYVSEVAGGLEYHLTSDETQYSSLIETLSAQADDPSLDLDFDLPTFNLPITINGNATVSFTMGVFNSQSATIDTTLVTTVKIRKWDGSTETDIVSVDSPSMNHVGTQNSKKKELVVVPLTIPKTLFKKGETLRISMILTGTTAQEGQSKILLGHDPRNRDGTHIVPSTDDPDTITKLIFKAPFDIDL